MSDFSLWSSEAEELIRAFTNEELSSDSVASFFSSLNFGEFEEDYTPMSAERLVLVYSDTDYVFRSNELSWLKHAPCVVSGECENGVHIYAVEMDCDIEDYYISCAAVIKLFNVIFDNADRNLYIFKFPDAVAFGSCRIFEQKSAELSFCVSGLISASDPNADYSLLEDLTWDDFSLAISRHSPQEQIDSMTKYDQTGESSLSEMLSSFDVGIGEEKKRQLRFQYAGDGRYQRVFSYKDTKKLLSEIGQGNKDTSLDVLENAEEAEEKAMNSRIVTDNVAEQQGSEIVADGPDADALMNDILDNYSRF